MMNMGGLRRTMPVTFITFLIGGLSLAGFPLITAGFWSKDEILADAYLGLTHGYGPHALVFVLLAIAAFLTAFYTMRQLGLTFWGEPRTEEAAHASLGEGLISATMTFPLIFLAFFAVVAGFVGVPSDFPILGGIFAPEHSWFHHFVGPTLFEEPGTITFNWFPLLTSFVVALGGLALGWLMYWRKPLEAGQPDPLVAILGPLHPVLKNKYGIDELYGRVFVQPSQWFARVVVNEWMDNGLIDGILHLIARIFVWIGDLLKVLNTWLIDGFGDGVSEAIAVFGNWIRYAQTGRVQQYLLWVVVAALIIGLIFAFSTGVLQAGG
jgi:NADH-quinone oxidoreductase subunit L